MSDATRILLQIESGEPHSGKQLLPLVYDELRKLAAVRLAQEKPGQTLDATGLVHEAYLRLMAQGTPEQENPMPGKTAPPGDAPEKDRWNNRGHFFAAAAEAMRRILVEHARHKHRLRYGGDRQRVELQDAPQPIGADLNAILAVDEALVQLTTEDPPAAAVVRLHFFAGLSLDETAEALGISRATVYRQWAYARAWLKLCLQNSDTVAPD